MEMQPSSPHSERDDLSVTVTNHGDRVLAIYIKVKNGQSERSRQLGDGDVILDIDAHGELLGIEILQVDENTSKWIHHAATEYNVPALNRLRPEKFSGVFA